MSIQKDTTTLPGKTIIFDDANGGVAIDYSDQLERIATSLERISGEDSTLGIERIVNIIEEIKDLAAGPGIRTLSPYETFNAIAIYKLFVEEGKVLKFPEGEASDKEKADALDKILEYVNKIKSNIPKEF